MEELQNVSEQVGEGWSDKSSDIVRYLPKVAGVGLHVSKDGTLWMFTVGQVE